jgi:sugar phosphate isomerase/epimerase
MTTTRIGLNPFGLAYSLGLQGRGTPRANPSPLSLFDYVVLAEETGITAVIELPVILLEELSAQGQFDRLQSRLRDLKATPVIAGPGALALGKFDLSSALRFAEALGARVMRVTLTPVLQGDRAEPKFGWSELCTGVCGHLRRAAEQAAPYGVSLALENHQDFTSTELIELCIEAGENVGVCLDTGNALAVAEDPVDFARTIAPRVRHVHLKDYFPQWTDEGYRLVRCAIGDGAIPFPEILQTLEAAQPTGLTAAIECGALEARAIRVLSPVWWQGYPPRSIESIAAGLRAARVKRLPEDAPWQTPWEANASPEEIATYEQNMVRRSAENLRALGLLKESTLS